MRKILLLVLILVLSCSFIMPVDILTSEEKLLFNVINEVRQQNGLHAFELSNLLIEISSNRSTDMILNNYFTHVNYSSFRGIKRTIRNQTGTRGNIYLGEILMRIYLNSNPGNYIQYWLDSPSHRAVILDTKYGFRKIGIGIVEGDVKIITIYFSN